MAQRFDQFLGQITALVDGGVRDSQGLGQWGQELPKSTGHCKFDL
jgi:methyl-accepting chemotaxis protein